MACAECLTYALTPPVEKAGIYGGMTAKQRGQLRGRIQRSEGMLGFDFVTHKLDIVPADSDMEISVFEAPSVETNRDRFDLTLTQGNTAIVLDRGTQLIGTGAFMFEQRPNLRLLQSARSIRLVRNPHYHGRTGVDEVEFRVCPADEDGTPRQLLESLRQNEVDLTTALTMADVSANQISGVAPALQPGNSTGILFFNCERRVLADPKRPRMTSLSFFRHDEGAKGARLEVLERRIGA